MVLSEQVGFKQLEGAELQTDRRGFIWTSGI